MTPSVCNGVNMNISWEMKRFLQKGCCLQWVYHTKPIIVNVVLRITTWWIILNMDGIHLIFLN